MWSVSLDVSRNASCFAGALAVQRREAQIFKFYAVIHNMLLDGIADIGMTNMTGSRETHESFRRDARTSVCSGCGSFLTPNAQTQRERFYLRRALLVFRGTLLFPE
jgi:hypothetical protein